MQTLELDLSIVLPCLNEAETLSQCIRNAKASLSALGLTGEIIVADNGSTDGSQNIAKLLEAMVVDVPLKGYGSALMAGISSANSNFIVMADADDSYELENLRDFYEGLVAGHDLVMGNRFTGGIQKGAMPWLHKYLGNPILSFLGRKMFSIRIGDFHCGIRALNKRAIENLDLKSKGMEFASEMVIKAAMSNLSILEVPTILRKDGRSREPHLRTWRDGWRHLKFMLMMSPTWLFIIPGALLSTLSAIILLLLWNGPVTVGEIQLSQQTFILSIFGLLISLQFLLIGIIATKFQSKFMPKLIDKNKIFVRFSNMPMENFLLTGLTLLISGLVSMFISFTRWASLEFGQLVNFQSVANGSITGLLMIGGLSIICLSFILEMIDFD